MVGSDGRPLSGREGLDLLRNMNTLSRLRDRGFQVFEFTALVPPPTTEEPPRVTNNSLRGEQSVSLMRKDDCIVLQGVVFQ